MVVALDDTRRPSTVCDESARLSVVATRLVRLRFRSPTVLVRPWLGLNAYLPALKEMPGLTKGLLFIKVISVVAPLMGLLGTVTGMIKTFQVITLYGAGDPKMMAGGISQALMTTVLGLVVAIPMVLLHTVVSGQSRKVINILQSQSAGLVARHSESHHQA